jgi:TetR/AcrR family transcriptional regulator, cholesterol catabolism regulator
MTNTLQETGWLDRVESLFMRFGIKSITMDDVAADLGISKKTLYQMVESKDDLVIKVLEHHISREKTDCLNLASKATNAIDEIFILLDSNSQEIAQMKTNIINDLQKYHRQAWDLIQKFHFDFVFKVFRENLQRGRKEGLYREDFDIDILAKLHLATAFNLFDPQLFPDDAVSKVTVFQEYMLHYLHGIVSPKGLTYLKKKLS